MSRRPNTKNLSRTRTPLFQLLAHTAANNSDEDFLLGVRLSNGNIYRIGYSDGHETNDLEELTRFIFFNDMSVTDVLNTWKEPICPSDWFQCCS
ncbi:hypothetical protein P9112_009985 [Eukaryota sp. TZLM1-RC]